MTTLGILSVAAVIAGVIGFFWLASRKMEIDKETMRGTLQAALVKMVRLMENNPRTMPGRQKESRREMYDWFSRMPGPHYSLPHMIGVDFDREHNMVDRVQQAKEIVEWNESMASDFWKKAQRIRSAAIVLLILLRDRNITGAVQMREDLKELFPDLHDILGDLNIRRWAALEWAIDNPTIYHNLDFRPFDEDVQYDGIAVLTGMRNYTR